MKIKHLFLTVVAMLACVNMAMAVTDQITYADVVAAGDFDDPFYTATDMVKSSGATYTVYAQENAGALLFTDGASDIVTTTTGGRIQSVTVTWAATGNNNKKKIVVYGKTSAYANDGSEWEESLGEVLAEIVYPQTTASGLDAKKCSFVMVAGESEPIITSISFDWMDVTTNNVTIGDHDHGTIVLDKTSAEPGETVTATFTGGKSGRSYYELQSYTIDGVTTALSEAEYTSSAKAVSFTMPAHDVEVSAIFGLRPSRTTNSVTVNEHAQLDGTTITIVSGSTYTFNFKADYALEGSGSHAPYTQDVTVKASNSNMASLSNSTYSSATGTGSFKLKAYNQGTSKLTFSTVQTNDYNAGTFEYTIVVVPREVMMITQYDGKYYAVANNLDVAGKLAAQEVMASDGTVYVYSDGTYTEDQLKWKVCTKTDGTYTIQNSANKYLGYSPSSPATMTLTSSAYNWYKYSDEGQDRFFNNNNEIIYFATKGEFADYSYDKCLDNAAYSHGAYEVDAFQTITAREIRSDLTADKFSTMCLSYSFIAGDGLSIYNVDNYEEKNGAYHFYFCRHDEGEVTTAGEPYIIKSTSNVAKVYQVGDENAAAGNNRGLYGTKTNLGWSTVWGNGNYTLGNVLVINGAGEIKYANGGGGVYAGRAYMLLSEIPTVSDCSGTTSAGVARRASLSVEAAQTPTDVEKVESAEAIDWNEPVYNVVGQLVGRGAKGVLIQNGKKYLAQ